MKNKISPMMYITCGAVVTLAMGVIKLTGWILNRAVVTFIIK